MLIDHPLMYCSNCDREVYPSKELKSGIKYVCKCKHYWVIGEDGSLIKDVLPKDSLKGHVGHTATYINSVTALLALTINKEFTKSKNYIDFVYNKFKDTYTSKSEMNSYLEAYEVKPHYREADLKDMEKVLNDMYNCVSIFDFVDMEGDYDDTINALLSLAKKEVIKVSMYPQFVVGYRNVLGKSFIPLSEVPAVVEFILDWLYFSKKVDCLNYEQLCSQYSKKRIDYAITLGLINEAGGVVGITYDHPAIQKWLVKKFESLKNWPDSNYPGFPLLPSLSGNHILSDRKVFWDSSRCGYIIDGLYRSVTEVLLHNYVYGGRVVEWPNKEG